MFFDTHAILGILNGEPRYDRFRTQEGYTHQMNVVEALVHMLRRGVATPRHEFDRLGLGLVPAHDEDLELAARLKVDPTLRDRNLSLVDAFGYAIARRLALRFLTGDPGFRGLEGVEFAHS